MNKNQWIGILYALAGLALLAFADMGGNVLFIVVGFCLIFLSSQQFRKH